jgi:hypothetical protein
VRERYGATLALRFRVPNVMAKWVEPNQPGIVCVALPGLYEHPELVLLVDEPENTGASLTNSIELVLKYLHDFWGPMVSWDACQIIQRDSTGSFNIVEHVTTKSGVAFVGWKPISSVLGREANSLEAAVLTFGPLVQQALGVVEAVRRGFR